MGKINAYSEIPRFVLTFSRSLHAFSVVFCGLLFSGNAGTGGGIENWRGFVREVKNWQGETITFAITFVYAPCVIDNNYVSLLPDDSSPLDGE